MIDISSAQEHYIAEFHTGVTNYSLEQHKFLRPVQFIFRKKRSISPLISPGKMEKNASAQVRGSRSDNVFNRRTNEPPSRPALSLTIALQITPNLGQSRNTAFRPGYKTG